MVAQLNAPISPVCRNNLLTYTKLQRIDGLPIIVNLEMPAQPSDNCGNASTSPRKITWALPVICDSTGSSTKDSKKERNPPRRITKQRRPANSSHLAWHGDCIANLNSVVLQNFTGDAQQQVRSKVAGMNGGPDSLVTGYIGKSASTVEASSGPSQITPRANLIIYDKYSGCWRDGEDTTTYSDALSCPTVNQYSSAGFQFLRYFA